MPPQGGRKHPNQEYIQLDTVNVLFICGGAFVDLDKIINERAGNRTVGYSADAPKSEKELLADVRPEDLVLDTSQAPVVASGTLAFTESLGSETLLHIGVDEATLVARTPGLPPAGVTHHRRLPVGVRPRSAHLFTQDADHQRVALSTRDS